MSLRRFASSLACIFATVLGACDSNSPGGEPPGPGADGGPGGDDDGSVASTCAPTSGPGTTHASSPTADETWTAADSPHIVTAALSIAAGRTLTLEPCAVVKIKGSIGFTVQGKLVATGAADKRIRIERADDTAWTSIETRAGAELRFSYVTVEGGGNSNGGRPTQFGAIDVRGDQELAPQPIFFADHVTVRGSESLGVWAREGGAFAPGSQSVTVTGGATFPVLVWGNAAGTLPAGSYTGNAEDEIFLPAFGGRDDIRQDMTLPNRGVPYRVGGSTGGSSLTVGDKGAVPLLTIDPGVTLRFAKNTRLLLSNEGGTAIGALRAEGTADKPIVFTSAEAAPAAGDWTGILIAGTPDPRDKIAFATIAYAGGTSGVSSFDCPSPLVTTFVNEGAIVIHGGRPGSSFVTNTTFDSSAGDGVVRGWTGDPLDFLATNTFTNIARCHQTFPRPNVGVCPNPTECPQ
ncbi:MAG: hypothetical protein KF819_28220 [Labilithrix sp.]|nr:hypothetical protein [Labilithrix sp.]